MSNKKGRVTTRIMREKQTIFDYFHFSHFLLVLGVGMVMLAIHEVKLSQDRATMVAEANMIIKHSLMTKEVTGSPWLVQVDMAELQGL